MKSTDYKTYDDKTWRTGREKGVILQGCVRCKFANIFLPNANGQVREVWSFNTGKEVPIIYDDPYFEVNWQDPENPMLFSANKPIVKPESLLDASVLHIGRLTIEAMQEIVKATKGRGHLVEEIIETNNYVLYAPARFRWSPVGDAGNLFEPNAAANDKINLALLAALAVGVYNS